MSDLYQGLERREAERREGFCQVHEVNTGAIAKQGGQWKMLLWILGIGISLMVSIAGAAYWSQQESMETVKDSVQNIDKAMTAYIASHTVESREGFRRIGEIEEEIDDIKEDIDILRRGYDGRPHK